MALVPDDLEIDEEEDDDDVVMVVLEEDVMEAEQMVLISKYCGSSITLRWHQAYFLTLDCFSCTWVTLVILVLVSWICLV